MKDFELFAITFLRVKQFIAAYCSYSVGIIFRSQILRPEYKTRNPNGGYPPNIRYLRISISKGQRIFLKFYYFFQPISKLELNLKLAMLFDF